VSKLQRTLALIVLLHVRVSDLLVTLAGEEDPAANESLDLLQRSKLTLPERE